jgi:hypothetical protein
MSFLAIILTLQVAFLEPAKGKNESLQPARFAPAKPREPKEAGENVHYVGTVKEVTKKTISIEWPGEPKPKRFSVSEILGSGGFPTRSHSGLILSGDLLRSSFCYRLTDVQVGDHVQIYFYRLDGVDICDRIRIDKRPGGLVPPLPKGVENLESPLPADLRRPGEVYLNMFPYHERMNALWELEDKGIPFPEKFGPWRCFPLAPMPRALGLDGPLISP